MKKSILKIIILSIFLFSSSLYANFADTYGFSAKGISKGNAVTATVDDWSSVYYNMAGLGKTKYAKKNELALSYMYTMPSMDLKIDKEVPSQDELGFGTITLGLTLDLNTMIKLPKVISSARFGIGMGLMQDGTLVTVNDLDIRSHTFMRYGREIERAVILSGIGLGFLDDMFGIGLGTNIWTKGSGKIQMKDLELNSEKQTPPQSIQMDLSPAISPIIGLYFSHNGIDIGFNYRGEIYMELPLDTDASMRLSGIDLSLGIYILDFYTPTILSFGGAYTVSNITFSLDLEYQKWSGFRISKAQEIFIANYNEDNGTNVKLPTFNDIFLPKLGVSYKISNSFKASLGYTYRPTFLPEDTNRTLFNFLDSNTQLFSTGVTFIVPDNSFLVGSMEINLSAQYQLISEQNVVKDSKFKTELNPDYTYSGGVISVFAELLMRF